MADQAIKAAKLVTIRLVQGEDENVSTTIEFADWLDMISPKEAHKLLRLATANFESATMPYYIRSQGPEGR